jgi:hypothetical protein
MTIILVKTQFFKKMCSMFSFPHIFLTFFSTVVRLFEAAGTVILARLRSVVQTWDT